MGIINVLDKHIAELIAAGEVVERPSSVIKELIENSIDAGAKNITVEIKNGGTTFMRVSDDGCGIRRDDVKVAFLRHATSKVKVQSDLDCISTLGFRGEALASISAVSRLQLITRNANDDIGTTYEIDGGEEVSFEDAGCPVGTTFVIRDLFYNIPARAKFLKKDVSEGNAVSNVIDKTALSHPEISFTYVRDGKQVLKTYGDNKLISAIYSVFGKDFAKGLIPVEYQLDAIKVYGYISKPEFARATRNMQNFFINGRYVKTRTAMAALEEAFKGSVMVGKFPSCVLNINIPYNVIDVNVHPAKIEVRFINERPVFDAVYHAVKSSLLKNDSRKKVQFKTNSAFNDIETSHRFNPFNNAMAVLNKNIKQTIDKPIEPPKDEFNPFDSVPLEESKEAMSQSIAPVKNINNVGVAEPFNSIDTIASVSKDKSNLIDTFANGKIQSKNLTLNVSEDDIKSCNQDTNNEENNSCKDLTFEAFKEKPSENNQLQINKDDDVNISPIIENEVCLRYIGEAFSTYIIVEKNHKELLLIDKHAAHERMIYEKLRAEKAGAFSQMLLQPVTVQLGKEEYDAAINNLEMFANCAFDVEDFGNSSVIVRSAPQYIDAAEISDCITEMADYISKGKNDIFTEKMDWFYHNVACRSAIKAGNKSTPEELIDIVKKLEENPELKYCPHGRPICIVMTKREIENQFGRV